MNTRFLLFMVFVGLLGSACSGQGAPGKMTAGQTNTTIERLGPLPGIAVRKVSPDGLHMAALVPGTEGDALLLDGVRTATWPRIVGGQLLFSPDSRRFAYIVEHGGREKVVLDGTAGPPFDEIGRNSLTFSSDSKRFAYTARKGEDAVVIEGGLERAAYDGRAPVFSPDSRRLAYVVQREKQVSVAIEESSDPTDRQLGPPLDAVFLASSIVFSPNSHRIAYFASASSRQVCVLDGRIQRDFHQTGAAPLVFSPDSSHYMYTAEEDGKWFLVRDGKPDAPCDGIGLQNTVFSPNSERWAYVVNKGNQSFVVFTEGRHGPYDVIATGSVTFSPDSQRLAFAARSTGDWFVVVDGKQSQPFSGFDALCFSPDSKHLAMGVKMESRYVLVTDGRIGPDYYRLPDGMPRAFIYSPDSMSLDYVSQTGLAGMSASFVIGGKPGPEFDEIIPGGRVYSSGGVAEYLAVKNSELFRIKQRL